MFQYYTRIFDKYGQPITALAIFTDAGKSYHPKQYRSKVLGTKITYTFNTYKIIEHNNATLEASDNPFAMVVLAAKLAISRKRIKDQQLFDNALHLAKFLLNKKMPKDKIRMVMSFLRKYIRFENNDMFTKFEQQIAILTEGSTAMGIEELIVDLARKEGMEKEKTQSQFTFTLSLLTSTDFNTAKIAQLVGVTEDFVLKVKKESNL